jgi:hypothetical protein
VTLVFCCCAVCNQPSMVCSITGYEKEGTLTTKPTMLGHSINDCSACKAKWQQLSPQPTLDQTTCMRAGMLHSTACLRNTTRNMTKQNTAVLVNWWQCT